MAFSDTTWYVNYGNGSSTGYYAVTQWATGTAKSVGNLIRQKTTPSVGSERVYVCIVAGTTHATTEPTWTTTRGAKVTDNTVTWLEVTGQPSMNGDINNTTLWTTIKNTAVSQGQIIRDSNSLRYFACTTAGTAGNGPEPSWNTTAGSTTADNTVTWTCLGTVGSFSAWGAPMARLQTAITGSNFGQANNTIYVGNNHAETQAAAMTLATGASSRTAPYKIICVNSAGSVPPVSANITTGATVTTTGANAMTLGFFARMHGIAFSAGSGATNVALLIPAGRHTSCSFTKAGTSANAAGITTTSGSTVGLTILDNCSISVGNASDSFTIANPLIWRNSASAVTGATLPTSLFKMAGGTLECVGLDLSNLGSGKTLVLYGSSYGYVTFRNCKLGASVTRTANDGPYWISDTQFINCDSGATNYVHSLENEFGTQTVETTIVRTGGATDGTTPISWKIVTTSLTTYVLPFIAMPMTIWNNTSGANVTVTVYGIWGGGAVPNNDDIWMEIHYPGSASFPTATINTSTMKADLLASAAGQPTDTSTWGGSTTKFKLTATLSSPQPGMKGPIYVYVCCAKASSTFYIDPQPVLT